MSVQLCLLFLQLQNFLDCDVTLNGKAKTAQVQYQEYQ